MLAAGSPGANTAVTCLRLFLHLVTFCSLFIFFWYAWWWLSDGTYDAKWAAWYAKLLLPYKYCAPNQLAGSVSCLPRDWSVALLLEVHGESFVLGLQYEIGMFLFNWGMLLLAALSVIAMAAVSGAFAYKSPSHWRSASALVRVLKAPSVLLIWLLFPTVHKAAVKTFQV